MLEKKKGGGGYNLETKASPFKWTTVTSQRNVRCPYGSADSISIPIWLGDGEQTARVLIPPDGSEHRWARHCWVLYMRSLISNNHRGEYWHVHSRAKLDWEVVKLCAQGHMTGQQWSHPRKPVQFYLKTNVKSTFQSVAGMFKKKIPNQKTCLKW